MALWVNKVENRSYVQRSELFLLYKEWLQTLQIILVSYLSLIWVLKHESMWYDAIISIINYRGAAC
jgi:hypothetical protein